MIRAKVANKHYFNYTSGRFAILAVNRSLHHETLKINHHFQQESPYFPTIQEIGYKSRIETDTEDTTAKHIVQCYSRFLG